MRTIWLPLVAVSVMIICLLGSGCLNTRNTETGTLQFASSPSGAEIYLDGEYRGTTPSTLTGISLGNHTLEYRYSGYTPWIAPIEVEAGTSRFSAALTQEAGGETGESLYDLASQAGSLPKVTLQVSKDPMIVGESVVFSGTCTNSPNVTLTLFGPGTYTQGIVLAKPKTSSVGVWSYIWSPGTKIQSGSYTIMAADARNISSSMTTFTVIGGGVVTVVPSSYATAPGALIKFSGRCTSGANNIRLVLYGPGRYSTGLELGTVSVLEDDTWSYKYMLDAAMPTGVYSIMVSDIPKTASATSQFTVGYTS